MVHDATKSAGPRGCLAEDTLIAIARGNLPTVEVSAVEAHLAGCSSCMEVLSKATDIGESSVVSAMASTRPSPGLPRAVEERLEPGTHVGRYVILALVGSGGMGSVYEAHDPDLDRRVAVKVLRAPASTDELRARLLREAKAMARLSHPNVITVYDVGTRGAQLFVAMEFVEGGTLRTWAQKPRNWREVLAKYECAGVGLGRAHAAGLVHRDFKPDNVLVGNDGSVRVTDFGLVRSLDAPGPYVAQAFASPSPLDPSITRSGAIVGTPAYMAPEQFLGGALGPSSDQFSFCVALYEALYGERPFAGDTPSALASSTARAVVRGPPPGARVPQRVRASLLRGLRPRPADRFPSMEALLAALRAAGSPDRRRRGLVLGGALLSVAVVAGLSLARSPNRGLPVAATPLEPASAPSQGPVTASPSTLTPESALPSTPTSLLATPPEAIPGASNTRAGATRQRRTAAQVPAAPPATLKEESAPPAPRRERDAPPEAPDAPPPDVHLGSNGVPILN